jgi:hypothetical protein
MKNSVIAIPSLHVVITTIVYALLAPIFFEMDNALGENIFVVNNNDKILKFSEFNFKFLS